MQINVFFFVMLMFAACMIFFVLYEMHKKNIFTWISPYIKRKKINSNSERTHIIFSFVDHFEPMWGKNSTYKDEVRRVDAWHKRYPEMASRHLDADGCHPKHVFYYPEEEYREEHLQKLVEICKDGYGEIEVHLHHDNDTENGLRKKISGFVDVLVNKHGALSIHPKTGKPMFGFIHGNWCLDNSRKDGRMCGVNNELIILNDLGCYCDFTLPSAPSETQTAKINSIYYATDDPDRPKSHNQGVDVVVGGKASGDLMIVQGPLALNWKDRKWGVLPSIENSDIRCSFPPTNDRVDLWIEQGIHVEGRPDWVFVKIHTHGTQDCDLDTLLGEPVDKMYSYLEEKYNDGEKYCLHYVSTREMYNIIKAAEAGHKGNPNKHRDYILPPPAFMNN